jgi:hypothetical protein
MGCDAKVAQFAVAGGGGKKTESHAQSVTAEGDILARPAVFNLHSFLRAIDKGMLF